MTEESLTDWKSVSSEKDEEISDLKKKISEMAKKNLELLRKKAELEGRVNAMQDVVENFQKVANNVQGEVDKVEAVWKNKVLESHRKIRALEKLLDDKRQKELDMKSLTLQKYVQTYKDKIAELEEELLKYKNKSKELLK